MALFFIQNEVNVVRKLQRRHIRDFANPFELPDAEFYFNYRMNKDMALYLCRELEASVIPQRSHGLPVHIKVLCAINYMATGSYQRKVGQDHNIAIAQTTVSKYLTEVVQGINQRLKPRWLTFPGTMESRERIAAGWCRKSGLPNILGAIDCTHISIFPPPRPEGIQYINRKGTHSIIVQLIVDADCHIINVNANYPGRVHDQFIFNHSTIKTEMRRLYDNRIGSYFLLGDSGYALEPWMMTPVLHAVPGSPADRYSQWQTQTRNVVERTNGYLKGTFRCLGIDQNLHYSPEKSSSIIYACCTLYNIMKYYRVPMISIEEDQHEPQQDEVDRDQPHLLQHAAIQRREHLIATYFN